MASVEDVAISWGVWPGVCGEHGRGTAMATKWGDWMGRVQETMRHDQGVARVVGCFSPGGAEV